MKEEKVEKNGMENNHKSKQKNFWERVMADVKMDNATKARIAEETVQDLVNGLQKTLNPEGYFQKKLDFPFESQEKSVKETRKKSLSADFELAEYRGISSEESGKKYSGRLFILRKREHIE